jgi:hypothetical protein
MGKSVNFFSKLIKNLRIFIYPHQNFMFFVPTFGKFTEVKLQLLIYLMYTFVAFESSPQIFGFFWTD